MRRNPLQDVVRDAIRRRFLRKFAILVVVVAVGLDHVSHQAVSADFTHDRHAEMATVALDDSNGGRSGGKRPAATDD